MRSTLAAAGLLMAGPAARALPVGCRDLVFEGVGYVVCEADLSSSAVRLHHRRADGTAYGDLEKLAAHEPFGFAMNAGMYHADMSAVGLYVEGGVEQSPLNSGSGQGNFFLKPNGVFFVDAAGAAAGVLETIEYAHAAPKASFATQSGPLLVRGGAIHPALLPTSQSLKIRNGVGILDPRRPVFAISRAPVSFHAFARLFRDALGCPDALYFDGTVSALHDGGAYLVGGGYPAGPIVAVRPRR